MTIVKHVHKLAFFIIASLCCVSYFQFESIADTSIYVIFQEIRNLTGLLSYIFLTLMLILCIKSSLMAKLISQLETFKVHKILAMYMICFILLHIYNKAFFISFIDEINSLTNVTSLSHASILASGKIAYFVLQLSIFLSIAFISIFLIKKLKYRYFLSTHKLIAALYVLLTCHIMLNLKIFSDISYLSYIAICTYALGIIASIKIISFNHKIKSRTIKLLSYRKDKDILRLTLDLKNDKLKDSHGYVYYLKYKNEDFKAISLAFVDNQGSHFFIKKESDKNLFDNIENIDEFTVQGPFYEYVFTPNKNVLYISNGTGITAFSKYLFNLKSKNIKHELLLIVRDKEDAMYKLYEKFKPSLANKINVHIYESKEKGRITKDKLMQYIKGHDEIMFSGSYRLKKKIEDLCLEHKLNLKTSYNEFRNIF